jgi:HAD superfamily hydrolase (TIGR01484 family)
VTFKPKLVVFDLDGTLAESKERMMPEMGELLEALLTKMPVAVMSGASFKQFEAQFLPYLPDSARLEHLYLFADNAAQCYVFDSGKWRTHYDHSFTLEEKKLVMQELKAAMAETGFDKLPEHVWGERIEDREAQITFSALGQQAPIEEKERYDPTRKKREPLYEALRRRLPDFSIGLNAATSIDITRHDITKAYGIKRLVEMSGISVSEMLYVGDALEEGGNDFVVMQSGVQTHPVLGPEETVLVIKEILGQHAHSH